MAITGTFECQVIRSEGTGAGEWTLIHVAEFENKAESFHPTSFGRFTVLPNDFIRRKDIMGAVLLQRSGGVVLSPPHSANPLFPNNLRMEIPLLRRGAVSHQRNGGVVLSPSP